MAHGYKHTTRRPWMHNQSLRRSEVVDETTLLELIGRPTVNDIQAQAREQAQAERLAQIAASQQKPLYLRKKEATEQERQAKRAEALQQLHYQRLAAEIHHDTTTGEFDAHHQCE